ncbi:MAG: hypothetical protein ACTSYY_05070 [Promethearchaeota archaeon]
MLNWSIGVIVGFIGFIPAFFAFTITVIQYFKDKYDHLRYLAGMWFFLSIWILFQGISDLFLSIELHFVCFYALIAFSFFGNLAVDTLTRDSVDLLKMIITTIISCFVIYFSLDLENFPAFNPEAIIIENAVSSYPTMAGNFRIAVLIQSIWLVSVAVYGSLKIFIHTPKKLKKYSSLNLFGTYLWGVQPIWIQFVGFEEIFPGIATGSMALGILLIAIIFIKNPKLAYILPVKVYRILIHNTKTEKTIFKHDWNRLDINSSEDFFSRMIQSINTVFEKTISKGNIREIEFDEAIATFKVRKDLPLVCALISSHSSITLRKAFNNFADDVFYNFEKNEINGKALLEKFFPFIP